MANPTGDASTACLHIVRLPQALTAEASCHHASRALIARRNMAHRHSAANVAAREIIAAYEAVRGVSLTSMPRLQFRDRAECWADRILLLLGSRDGVAPDRFWDDFAMDALAASIAANGWRATNEHVVAVNGLGAEQAKTHSAVLSKARGDVALLSLWIIGLELEVPAVDVEDEQEHTAEEPHLQVQMESDARVQAGMQVSAGPSVQNVFYL